MKEEQVVPTESQIRAAASLFGKRIFGYCCNVDYSEVEDLLSGALTVTEPQRHAFDALVVLLDRLREIGSGSSLPASLLLVNLNRAFASSNRTIFTVLRAQSGGTIWRPDTEDPVLANLAELVVAAYPHCLIEHEMGDERFGPIGLGTTGALYGYWAEEAFQKSFLDDYSLRNLFPVPADNPIEVVSSYYSSSGSGGGLQLAVLSGSILSAGYRLMLLRGGDSLEAFGQATCDVISPLRKAAAGEVADIPAFVGLNNVNLLDGGKIETPFGALRAYRQQDGDITPSAARPSVAGEQGTNLGVVLETSLPYELVIADRKNEQLEPWPTELLAAQAELSQRVERVASAITLAIERVPPVAAYRAWTSVIDPLNYSGPSWNPRASSPVSFHLITNDEADRIRDWAEKLATIGDHSIRIAHRRILSAASARTDPVDGFIDAVIAWENLFGAREGELRFRISGSMARLLEESVDERLSLQGRVAKIYDERSAIVHGSDEPEPNRAIELRNEALDLAIRCLRKLYLDLPYLLSDKDRAKKIMLED